MKIRILKYTLTLFWGLLSFSAYSQYITQGSGNWTDPIWNTALPSPDPYTIGGTITISSGDYVEVTGNNTITLSSQGSTLNVNGTLVISGSLIANKNNQEIHIGTDGMLIVLGDFDVGKNKFAIDAGGNFYVQGDVKVDKSNNKITVSGEQNIYFEHPPDLSVSAWPTDSNGDPLYNTCYPSSPSCLPDDIQEALGDINISVSPSTIEGCVNSDKTSFTFTLPTADATDSNYLGNIYYQVIKDYKDQANESTVISYTEYQIGNVVTVTGYTSGHTYSVLFYLGTSPDPANIAPGFKVVPINLSNTPTTGPIN